MKRITKGLIPKEVYEDIVDRETVTHYEEREKKGTVSFLPADDVLKICRTNN